MKFYKTEPQACKNCKESEPMLSTTAVVGDKIYEGWNCNDCGHFHAKREIVLKKHDEECDCPKCNHFEP